MSKAVIIYWSGTGNTESMANAILEGAREVNSDTVIFNVSDISAASAATYDTLILGCPAMGAEVLEESEFEPFFTELEPNLTGKKVALFGPYGWGDGEWMRNWEERVNGVGANLVCEGLMCNEVPDSDVLDACRVLGKKAAE